jgi:hypothetical protein
MPAKSLRHKKNLALSDGADPSIAQPSDWNNDHDLWLGSRTIVSSGALADSDHLSTVTLASGSALAISIAPAGAGGRVRSRHHAIATMPGGSPTRRRGGQRARTPAGCPKNAWARRASKNKEVLKR